MPGVRQRLSLEDSLNSHQRENLLIRNGEPVRNNGDEVVNRPDQWTCHPLSRCYRLCLKERNDRWRLRGYEMGGNCDSRRCHMLCYRVIIAYIGVGVCVSKSVDAQHLSTLPYLSQDGVWWYWKIANGDVVVLAWFLIDSLIGV